MSADVPPHGTRARYNSRRDRCRCPECNAANTRYMRLYRDAMRPADRRRWQQLEML